MHEGLWNVYINKCWWLKNMYLAVLTIIRSVVFDSSNIEFKIEVSNKWFRRNRFCNKYTLARILSNEVISKLFNRLWHLWHLIKQIRMKNPFKGIFVSNYFIENNFKVFLYSRDKSPTRTVLQQCIAELDGGKFCFAFPTGWSAIKALHYIKPGEHVIACLESYGGTLFVYQRFCWFNRYTIS